MMCLLKIGQISSFEHVQTALFLILTPEQLLFCKDPHCRGLKTFETLNFTPKYTPKHPKQCIICVELLSESAFIFDIVK